MYIFLFIVYEINNQIVAIRMCWENYNSGAHTQKLVQNSAYYITGENYPLCGSLQWGRLVVLDPVKNRG